VGNLAIEFPDTESIKIGPLEDTKAIFKALELLSEAGIEIRNIAITPPTLEEVFLNILDGHNDNNYKKNDKNNREGLTAY
jgi:hypothetical protein